MTEPEKVMMPRWRCTFCRRSWASRRSANAHAARCWFDPANRGCGTCVNHERNLSGVEHCKAGEQLPVIERFDRVIPVLAINCSSHLPSYWHVNNDKRFSVSTDSR